MNILLMKMCIYAYIIVRYANSLDNTLGSMCNFYLMKISYRRRPKFFELILLIN